MTFQGFAMQNVVLRTTKLASPRCLLEMHNHGGHSAFGQVQSCFFSMGRIAFQALLILSTSFSVPLRLLDAILSFHNRCNIIQNIKAFQKYFLCQSDNRMQCQININLQLLLLLYNQKMVQATTWDHVNTCNMTLMPETAYC